MAEESIAAPPEDVPVVGKWEKKVLVPAAEDAPTPAAGERVRVHVVGTCNGRPFEDSRARGLELELLIGRSNFVKGLDAALAGMRVGERASVLVDADAGWGSAGNRHLGVPSGASLAYDVELLGSEPEGELWDLSFERKMELAEWRRARGVELYKRGHAYFAHEEFLQGQRYLSFMLELSDDEAKQVRDAQTVSDLNCAATALRLGLERDALKHCDAVLAVSPSNAKAHYRRAQAYAALGDIAQATLSCDALLRHHPNDPDGLKLRARIGARKEELARKRQRFYKRMFSPGGADADDDEGSGGADCGALGARASWLLRRLKGAVASRVGSDPGWPALIAALSVAALSMLLALVGTARWR